MYCGNNPIVYYDPSGKDWDNVIKTTITTAVAGAASCAASGAYLGYIGAPFTEGLSVPACVAVGGLSGFVGGAVTGFVTGVINEFWN